jgi:uncharacterized protein (TIGR02453 family)
MKKTGFNAKLVLAYLRDLKKNNDRDWFHASKDRYDEARAEFKSFVQDLIHDVAKAEPAWAHLDAGDCLFRIHRDLRFSNDKTPYKTSFSASISHGGKSVHDPGVYVQIEPDGNSMLAGGLYQPTPAELVHIRSRIAADPSVFRSLARSRSLLRHFAAGINGDTSKTVRGYPPDHEAYEFIRIKSFCAYQNVADRDVEATSFPAFAGKALTALVPLCRWLGQARIDRTK